MKYAFFPGCTLDAIKGAKLNTIKVAEKLGIQLVEMDGWTCCGASHVQDVNELLALTLNARNISLAEKLGLPVLTVCNTCTQMLRSAKDRLDSDEVIREKVNEVLGETGNEYKGTSKITHLLWALIEDLGLEKLKEKVAKPLKGLKIAPFYGCHILRPQKIMGFDSINPHSLEDVISTLGAESVYYSKRLDCCGTHAINSAENEVNSLSRQICMEAQKAGAHCIVTPCPLCQMQLDMYQTNSKKESAEDLNIPVLHLDELLGLALGVSAQELDLKRHGVETGVLEKLL